jgi:hypothetical protein
VCIYNYACKARVALLLSGTGTRNRVNKRVNLILRVHPSHANDVSMSMMTVMTVRVVLHGTCSLSGQCVGARGVQALAPALSMLSTLQALMYVLIFSTITVVDLETRVLETLPLAL